MITQTLPTPTILATAGTCAAKDGCARPADWRGVKVCGCGSWLGCDLHVTADWATVAVDGPYDMECLRCGFTADYHLFIRWERVR